MESKKMQVADIIASLVSLQILDGDRYYYAKPHAFDLVIEGDDEKRSEVFEFELKDKSPFIYVKVDPKVKPMGEVPIGARLKLNWETLKNIEKEDAKLIEKVENGSKKPEFNPNIPIEKKLGAVEIFVPAQSFDEYVKFKSEEIFGGTKYLNTINKVGRDVATYMFSIKAENEYSMSLNSKKEIIVKMKKPQKFGNKVRAIYMDDYKSIPTSVVNNTIEFKLSKLGDICVYSDGTNQVIAKKGLVSKVNRVKPKKVVSSIKNAAIRKPIKTTNNTLPSSQSTLNNEKTTTKLNTAPESLESSNKADFEVEDDIKISDVSDSEKDDEIEVKENKFIIFFAIIAIIGVLGLSTYVYLNIGKKLLYELDLEKRLRKNIKGGKDEK